MTVELPPELPITGLPTGQVSPAALVCGDPARADFIARQLTENRSLSHKREYHAFQGRFQGNLVTVCSHGVGAPGAAAAFEELIAAGARRVIRVGTCGGLQPEIVSGQLVIASAAVDNSGYGREMVPPGYPAVADLTLTRALQDAADNEAGSYHTGIVLTRDSFYTGVPVANAPDYRAMSAAGVQAVEMECAALFIVGSLRRIATAAILVADGNVLDAGESMAYYNPGQPVVQDGIARATHIALSALVATA